MNLDQVYAVLKHPTTKQDAIDLADAFFVHVYSVTCLIDWSFDAQKEIGFRAAWILEIYLTKYRFPDSETLVSFLERFSCQQNSSAQRHFAKILSFLSDPKSGVSSLVFEEERSGLLIETTFNWLNQPETPVAVKSHCLTILAHFSVQYPWLRHELWQTMELMEGKESVAFAAKAREVRKTLLKNKKARNS